MDLKRIDYIKIKPIGIIHSPFTQAAGTPIQPSVAEGAEGVVEIFPAFVKGLQNLNGFDRIWLLYWFHKASKAKLKVKPYMDNAERGLFATRAPCRPNPIGISAVRLLRVEGCELYVADIDILDGTPLLDIKPYAPRFDHFQVNRFGWLQHAADTQKLADERFYQDNDK